MKRGADGAVRTDCTERQEAELEVMESMFLLPNEFTLHNQSTVTIAFLAWPLAEPKLHFSIPALYPVKDPIQVQIESYRVSDISLQTWQSQLQSLAESMIGDESMYALYSLAQELLTDVFDDDEKTCDEALVEDSEIIDCTIKEEYASLQPQQQVSVKLGRRAIYFHHIIANSKRKVVKEWASQLNLGGYSKIGWPGVVIVEGLESHCQEYVRALQHLRWKQMVVRGEQIIDGEPGVSLEDLRALPSVFQEFPMHGMSDLATACREAGLEDLFLSTMKIYKKTG